MHKEFVCSSAGEANVVSTGEGQKGHNPMNVRLTTKGDIPDLKEVLRETGLFPADMLPELLDSFLSAGESEDYWLTCEHDGSAIGFCDAVPEKLAEGTWNMLAIAVSPEHQGTGAGRAMVDHLESGLRKAGHRVMIADTSGTYEFANTQEFYRKRGYTEEARIRDFWAAGDDKIVFWKAL